MDGSYVDISNGTKSILINEDFRKIKGIVQCSIADFICFKFLFQWVS